MGAHAIMRRQGGHQLTKRTHAAYLFHLSGCKWLLREFLRLPLAFAPTHTPTSSAARPAWNHLLRGLEKHKNSEKYCKAVENSERKGEHHVRLYNRLWWARHDHEKGKISFEVRAGIVEFDSLSQRDQE